MPVRVNLKNTFRYNGVSYGPGQNVEVPRNLATALGLTVLDEPTEDAPKVKAKPAASKDTK